MSADDTIEKLRDLLGPLTDEALVGKVRALAQPAPLEVGDTIKVPRDGCWKDVHPKDCGRTFRITKVGYRTDGSWWADLDKEPLYVDGSLDWPFELVRRATRNVKQIRPAPLGRLWEIEMDDGRLLGGWLDCIVSGKMNEITIATVTFSGARALDMQPVDIVDANDIINANAPPAAIDATTHDDTPVNVRRFIGPGPGP